MPRCHRSSRPNGASGAVPSPRCKPVKPIAAVLLALALIVSGVAGIDAARAEVTDADIQKAKERLISAQASADQATAKLNAAKAAEAQARDRIRVLNTEIAELVAKQEALDKLIDLRAVEAYKNAGRTPELAYVVQAADLTEATEASAYIERVLRRDANEARELRGVKADLDAKMGELKDEHQKRKAARASAVGEQKKLTAALESAKKEKTRLEEQKAAEDRARAEAARRALEEAQRRQRAERERQAAAAAAAEAARKKSSRSSGSSGGGRSSAPAPPPPARSGRVCPVGGGTSFSDTWGAPRSGGRRHKGVDMFAARGTPLVAIESGTITRTGNGGLGGITLWLRGDSGASYYYAHNSSNSVGRGARVSAGQMIARVGTTGNARGTSPHVHFEYHPGGRGAVNPTPLVRGLC